MSLAYVTVSEQKEYSRIYHTALDSTILLIIQACSAGVKNYLKDFSPYEGQRNTDDDYVLDSNYEPEIELDSNSDQAVKPEVKLAVLIWADKRLRREEGAQGLTPPAEVVQLLYSLRDPALR